MRNQTNRLLNYGLGFIVCIVSVLSACVSAKNNLPPFDLNSPRPTLTPAVQRVECKGFVKSDGWKIPDVTSMRISKTGTVKQSDQAGNTIEVDYVFYVPVDNIVIDEIQPLGHESRMLTIKVTGVTSLGLRGKTYAYNVIAFEVSNQGNGKYTEKCPGLTYRYFDEDGNGSFELNSESSYNGYVPDWVMR